MQTNESHQLILGGARSGKSSYAENLVLSLSKQPVYVATGQALDSEMGARIEQHKNDRDRSWTLIEEPLDLSRILRETLHNETVLIDCLTLWISNCLHANCWPKQKEEFLNALKEFSGKVVMVSNEVGSGVIPLGELSREFVDESGWLHQRLAEQCATVTLVIAGIATHLKQ